MKIETFETIVEIAEFKHSTSVSVRDPFLESTHLRIEATRTAVGSHRFDDLPLRLIAEVARRIFQGA